MTILRKTYLEKSLKTLVLSNDEDFLLSSKTILDASFTEIKNSYNNGKSPNHVLLTISWFIDRILCIAWERSLSTLLKPDLTLIAVGGYGRQELHPYSDIDLLILTNDRPNAQQDERLTIFIQFLWDIGLRVGHSIRTVSDCLSTAATDITVMTNLMESRYLIGHYPRYISLRKKIDSNRSWPLQKFVLAKMKEQELRHARYCDIAYNLEPHLKEGPGGLRDIHILQWISLRVFGTADFNKLCENNYLKKEELGFLIRGRRFLWNLRLALHFHTNRKEDRLLFDYQRHIAGTLYPQNSTQEGIERLMKRYFRTAKELIFLNEILLQVFFDAIPSKKKLNSIKINNRFNVVNGSLEIHRSDVFRRHPYALIEAFLIFIEDSRVKDIGANTVRQIREGAKYIDAAFRNNKKVQTLFIDIFKSSATPAYAFKKMDAYGVLGAYIPAFQKIVGQMQHDLFHVYTVDAHLLFVMDNLQMMQSNHEDLKSHHSVNLMQNLAKKYRLYIAALFHDIAKGRGGDHSNLGQKDVYRFCHLHSLSDYDSRFCSWLVEQHLLMSWTAQREDISDPQIIDAFAEQVGDQEHLDNLYLLTIADMRATSPNVWNDWKGKLLADLYHDTTRALRRGVGQPIRIDEKLVDQKTESLKLIDKREYSLTNELWKQFDDDYFIRNSPDVLAWHANLLNSASIGQLPLVDVRSDRKTGTLKYFICSPDNNDLLCNTTIAFERLNMNILDARVHRMKTNLVIMMFVVFGYSDQLPQDFDLRNSVERIKNQLSTSLDLQSYKPAKTPARLKHFPIDISVRFIDSNETQSTIIEVIAHDRPGLLLEVAKALHVFKLRLVNAKVATFGERAEDIFFVTDRDGHSLVNENSRNDLRDFIHRALSENSHC